MQTPLLTFILRQGDRSLVLAQRLLEYITRSPEIEEDMALSNIALDLIGQSRILYTYAGEFEGLGHDEDHFAFQRDPGQFLSPILVERPNTDFAHVIVRQFLHDAYAVPLWTRLAVSSDTTLAGLGAKASKEAAYHLRHSSAWVIRLGDGTAESHERATNALEVLWPCTEELFEIDEIDAELFTAGVSPDPTELRADWDRTVNEVLSTATLARPAPPTPAVTGGLSGLHEDDFDRLIGEMQELARAHPGVNW